MSMVANGREGWATRNIGLPPAVKRRLESLKLIPQEPAWRVVERLLDSYDLSHPKNAPQTAPEVSEA